MQTIRSNRVRTALTGLSVAWGVFMLIILLAVGKGITDDFSANMADSSSRKIQVWPGTTSRPSHGYREGRQIKLLDSDITDVAHDAGPAVKNVSTYIAGNANVSVGPRSVAASWRGVFPSELDQNAGLTLIDGRFINQHDIEQCSKVVVLPNEYAKELFPPDGKSALRSNIAIGPLSYRIVGITQHRWNRSVYIPYSTAKIITGNSENIESITVIISDDIADLQQAEDIEKDIRKTLSGNHGFDADDRSALWIWNQFADSMRGQQAMGILNISLWILGLLTLLSGIVGISNIMFVSVRERTHEIGIRRAIGAKPSSILSQIMSESVVITLLFGYIGILLGTVVSQLVKLPMGEGNMITLSVDLKLAFEVLVVLVIAGIAAGLFPALRALKIKPVEALMEE